MGSWIEYTPFLVALTIAITFHEAAHGFIAYLFGDKTAYMMGRVTINPLKHIDPFGTLLLPALMILSGVPFIFGYAKPVPVNFDRLYPRKVGMFMVAAAGPLTNLILAWLSATGLHFFQQTLIITILVFCIRLNIVLAVFNLLPLLPLDGGRMLRSFMPSSLAKTFAKTEPYGMVILLLLIMLPGLVAIVFNQQVNVLGMLIHPSVDILTKIIFHLAGNPL
ncbi:MAG: site-2 protease family protein [Proteobacteria bacterium]|nr:site-2 protease family protein [Pseudomonadota bacterium]